MPSKKKKPLYECTIAPELFKEWRAQTRLGDVDLLVAKLGLSKPTINKAIIYGFVRKDLLVKQITQFFTDRLNEEKQAAADLKKLAANESNL